MVRRRPVWDIWISVPEFQKKNAAVINVAVGAQDLRWFRVLWSLYKYFINVLFPLPALPVIQYRGSPLSSHRRKLSHDLAPTRGSWKIHWNVFS